MGYYSVSLNLENLSSTSNSYCRKPHRKNQTLAVAVVKLYLSDASTNHKVWCERVTGAVSFTKDYARKSYYLQIFDMQYYQPVRSNLTNN